MITFISTMTITGSDDDLFNHQMTSGWPGLWWSHLLQVAKTNKYFHLPPKSNSNFFCILWKIKNARQTGFEKGGEVATELRGYQIILHGLTQQQKQNCQISHISKVYLTVCEHVPGLNFAIFFKFWSKFANFVSASFLAHSKAQFSFIPALSSHCHSTFLWQWKCYSKSGWWWRRWWWSKVRSKLNAMFIFW